MRTCKFLRATQDDEALYEEAVGAQAHASNGASDADAPAADEIAREASPRRSLKSCRAPAMP